MNIDKIPKVGTTIGRKRFWDKARDVVVSLQKKEGRNVSVDERKGAGTVINVTRELGTSSVPKGACCVGETCSITTEGECAGVYQGDGTTCEPNPCEEVDCGSDTVTLCKCGHPGFSGDADGCVNPCTGQPGIYAVRDYCAGESCSPGCNPVHTGYAGPFSGPLHWWLTLTSDCGDCSSVIVYDPFDECSQSGGPQRCSDPECHDCATYTLTDEYTTELLIANTLAKFASDFGDCPDGCVITYELNEDETCCTAFCVAE